MLRCSRTLMTELGCFKVAPNDHKINGGKALRIKAIFQNFPSFHCAINFTSFHFPFEKYFANFFFSDPMKSFYRRYEAFASLKCDI